MKYFFRFLAILVIIAGVIYFVPTIRKKAENILSFSACNTPLAYQLGSIDPKFGLSNDQILQDIQQATNIWQSAEGKPLFIYTPGALLTVNFVYDQRAALDTQINQLQSQLSQNDASLKEKIANYKTQVLAFQQKLAAFNAEVDAYNQQGGVPKNIYDQLIKEQQDLNDQGNVLNQMARQLNLSTNDYNYNVSVLNGDISQFQTELTKKPEEGIYNGKTNTITIYFASNQQELLHTLAHEFGHAIGMVHVQDPHAIMYPYTTTFLSITPDDMQQLQYVCRNQSAIIHDAQRIDQWIFSHI